MSFTSSRIILRKVVNVCRQKSIVDQDQRDWSMQRIVDNIKKGVAPKLKQGLLYSTDLGVRNLQDVHDRLQASNDMFMRLPVEIRDLCKHDPRNFVGSGNK